MPGPDDIDFRPCPPGDEPARGLIAAMVAELRQRYAIPGEQLGVPLDPAELAPPAGTYLVGWAGGTAVAGGGLRTIGDRLGEIKRMYVVPERRGHGVARRLLDALEGAARELGMTTVRLDTGPGQPDARHLYESAGYRSVDNYNGNEHASYWGEKRLV